MQRGEIWWATLREPFGSEPGFRRPVLIVQDDAFNRSRIQTVIAIAITTNTVEPSITFTLRPHHKLSSVTLSSKLCAESLNSFSNNRLVGK